MIQDIQLDNSYSLAIQSGDFVIAESTRQHQEMLLLAYKGQFRQFPTVGAGIQQFFLEDATPDALKQEVIKQFELDGMQVDDIDIDTEGKIFVEAHYSNS